MYLFDQLFFITLYAVFFFDIKHLQIHVYFVNQGGKTTSLFATKNYMRPFFDHFFVFSKTKKFQLSKPN